MSCDLHVECPTSCRFWAPCLEECDHEACIEAIGFGAWLENQSIVGRPHILSADCWCSPAVENYFETSNSDASIPSVVVFR